jgi:hypothetical protein
MASIQIDSFNFDKLGTHQFNILIEQNNMSKIPDFIYSIMTESYQHSYFLGSNDSPIANKIDSTNHFDSNHFQFQLSSVYEQIRNTNISTHSLLVVHSKSALLQKLINFPCFYDIVQNRKKYNMGILIITDVFPKKFDILKKQLDYCLLGSIVQEQELLQFVGPLFEPPYLYLQIHKTIYNENNFIAIIWNSTSNNLQDRIYWFEEPEQSNIENSPATNNNIINTAENQGYNSQINGVFGMGGFDNHQRQLTQSPSNPPLQTPQSPNEPSRYEPSQNHHNLSNPSAVSAISHSTLSNSDKQKIWKKISMIEELLTDIKEYLK